MIYYINGYGSTSHALEAYYEKRNFLGEIVQAEMILEPKKMKHMLVLKDQEENEIVIINGVSAGDAGTGSQGTIEILKDGGFDISPEQIYGHSTFKIQKVK
ncbi:hypothetical protein [Hespellia stercorisuis]|uniref:Uncharacterized protein n=1 Tax=Hespellia stercorisuis DSM 15480 TaxID=1121950 RepID=A0A1M6UM99_9FIRM|nr:hypothetical protein [Hespellia stercorisuis]SHK70352.1 hypothetical protein SAMN02745243_03546 [Hespellia stercorisuis DSM 15480]